MRTRRFWTIVLILLPILLVGAALFRVTSFTGPARPDLPWPGDRFIAEYGFVRSSIGHSIYYHGLFGFDRIIRASNIVLVGSSHMELGISAQWLSALTNRNVFNLGLGCNEPGEFGLDILRVNGATKKLVVADLYGIAGSNLNCGPEAAGSDYFQAYANVLQAWTEFAFDWCADPVLPRILLRGSELVWSRFLGGVVVINDWKFGGAAQVWFPSAGTVYGRDAHSGDGAAVEAVELALLSPRPTVRVPESLVAKAFDVEASVAATLVPYAMTPAQMIEMRGWVEETLSGPRVPFLSISPAGLLAYDGDHLSFQSSLEATERLAVALERLKLYKE